MMNRAAAVAVSILCWNLLAAQTPQEAFALLVRDNRLEIQCSFTVTSGDKSFEGAGSIISQDGAYIFSNSSIKIFSDTKTLWSVSSVMKEVVVEKSAPVDVTNPQSILSVFGYNPAESEVKVRYGDGFEGLSAVLQDGTAINVTAQSVCTSPKGDMKDFSFDVSALDSSWLVTDMR